MPSRLQLPAATYATGHSGTIYDRRPGALTRIKLCSVTVSIMVPIIIAVMIMIVAPVPITSSRDDGFDILRLRRKPRFPLPACAKLFGMLKVCDFNSYEGPWGGSLLIDGWAATCRSLAP
jgi:hypothetical protein